MYPFPLAVQTVLPSDYRENTAFQDELRLLQKLGFTGVELNIAYPENENMADIQRFLERFELHMTMFATGLTAKTHGLSLSNFDDTVWENSLDHCRAMIDFVAGTETGIIIGFLKGGLSCDVQGSRKRFTAALQKISPYAVSNRVQVLVEATNRYESTVANDLAATVELILNLDTDYIRILPDTFHMNIEEGQGIAAALKQWTGSYPLIHLSDNNRLFPGLGAIDFDLIIGALKETGFEGTMAIEGNLQRSFAEDIRTSAQFLSQLPVR